MMLHAHPGFPSFPIQDVNGCHTCAGFFLRAAAQLALSRGGDRLVPIELESVDHSEGLLMLQFAGSTVGPGERWAKSCWTNDF